MDDGRREFLKSGAKVVAVAADPWTFPRARCAARRCGREQSCSSSDHRVAGPRRRPYQELWGTTQRGDRRALCDIDDNVMNERLAQVRKMG